MAWNVVPITARSLPWDQQVTAGGGYTLPKHVFLPHPATQPISSGHIPQPPSGMAPSIAIASPNLTGSRPLPGAAGSGVYGIRSVHFKASPG